MITSIFSKSKPINFIIVFFITLLAFIITRVDIESGLLTTLFILKQSAVLFVVFMTILLLNFIVSKNSLTKENNYEILLYSLFLLFITQTTTNTDVIISNFFVLLGLRRIVSLRSQKDIKKKLFDSAIWIAVAALFYFWSILFFGLIIMSLILYTDNNARHWIIPFIGVATVFVISMAVSILFYDGFFNFFDFSLLVSYDFNHYDSTSYIVALTILLSFGIWSSLFYLNNIKKKKKGSRASFKIIIIAAITAFIIVLQAPQKNGSEFLFLFAPLAIIISNYIEIIQEKWFKEIFVLVLFTVPFLLLFL